MAAIKIGTTDISPVVAQSANVQRAALESARRQAASERPKPFNPYVSYRQESITCRETTAGTYEAVLGNDPVVHEAIGHKGQIVDLWI